MPSTKGDGLLCQSFDDGMSVVLDLESRQYYALDAEQTEEFSRSLDRRAFLKLAGVVAVELSQTIAGSCSHPIPGVPPEWAPPGDCPPGHRPGWP